MDRPLIPAIEQRIGTLMEFGRRTEHERKRSSGPKNRPTITLSREYGCEAFPVAEQLRELLENKTGEHWLLMDKALLEEVSRNHSLSAEAMAGLGEKSRFLDEILATFSPRWKTEKDYFRLICRHMLSVAEKGNVILVGRGSAFVTAALENCHHFRMYASRDFKIRSIGRRLGIQHEEAEKLISLRQTQRDRFIRDFLDRDARDLSVYDLVFNNDRNPAGKTARTILEYILSP